MRDRTGGYAWLIVDDVGQELGGGHEFDTTISRMELTAAISALQEILIWEQRSHEDRTEGVVLLYSDSEYLVKGFMNKSRNRTKNVDLWLELEDLATWFEIVHMEHVKGHAGHGDNEAVDKLAGEFRQAAVQELKDVTTG